MCFSNRFAQTRHLIILFLCLTVASSSGITLAENPEMVSFDFDNIDIRSFIRIVSELTGRNYVVDPAVKGQITVTSPTSIPKAAVPEVFQSVLDVYGFAAVSQDDIVKIVPHARAREGGEVVTTGGRRPDDSVITRVFRVNRADINELRSVIKPLLSRAGNVTVHSGSRTLILTDLAGNVQRLEDIIRVIDGGGPKLAQITRVLEHASAEAIAAALTAMYAAQPPESGIRPVIVAEPRTNSLLIHTAQIDSTSVLKIIDELDVQRQLQRSTLKVIRLHYAEASEVSKLLNSQLEAINTTTPGSRSTSRSSTSPVTTPQMVTSDSYTNSIVIAAPPESIAMMERVIQELDIPRKQILVEALIAEVSTDVSHELGVEWRLTDAIEDDGTTTIGGTSLPVGGDASALASAAANPLALPPGLAMGIVDGSITWGGTTIANIGALARAMEGTSGVNVLSTPHILALDNEEAEIIVGEERPFLKSSQTTDTSSVIRTYEFKDVGLTLRVTPRTTEDGQVILKIYQEIRSFLAESDIGAVTTSKRQTKTTVRTGDGQVVAIGGLLKEDSVDLTTAVPCLGAIPVLGHLFKSVKTSTEKTNLLIFMTPTIIPDASTLESATDKYQQRLESSPEREHAIDIPLL